MSSNWQQRALDRYYSPSTGFVDGTTEFHRLLADIIPPQARILEIGAGPSNATSDFLANLGEVTGLDVDSAVYQNRALRRAVIFDGGAIPLEDASFDVCVSNYVLEHVPTVEAHFAETFRILDTGGAYAFRTPNIYHYAALGSRLTPHWIHEALANRLRGLDAHAHKPYPTHYLANSRHRLKRLATLTGYQVHVLRLIEKEPSYGMWKAFLFYPLMVYERVVNSSRRLEGLRSNILGVFHKQPGRRLDRRQLVTLVAEDTPMRRKD